MRAAPVLTCTMMTVLAGIGGCGREDQRSAEYPRPQGNHARQGMTMDAGVSALGPKAAIPSGIDSEADGLWRRRHSRVTCPTARA